MDSNLIDLDVLINRIREPASRKYYSDAVRAYRAGALRAAIAAVWVAVVYDLLAKYRELSAAGDNAARDFIDSWDAATERSNVDKLLKLENEIVENACSKLQIIDPIAKRHLHRIRADRHLCAHPAFSAEAELFEPSPELVRLHLVNAIELVLASEPLQGKVILEQFSADVLSTGFPTEPAKILDYVEQRYLKRIKAQNLGNLGAVLAKSLLQGTPAEWRAYRPKIALSLAALRERRAVAWPDIRAHITRIMDGIAPGDRLNAIAFIAQFPDFWGQLQEHTRTTLQEALNNTGAADLADLHVLSAIRLPQFEAPLQRIIAELTENQLEDAIEIEPLLQLWPRACRLYADSGSFRGSEGNFRVSIMPFAGRLTEEHVGEVLEAVAGNGQNWDAAQTPTLLEQFLQATEVRNMPPHQQRDQFYLFLTRFPRQLRRYQGVVELLCRDGWAPPAVPQEEEIPF